MVADVFRVLRTYRSFMLGVRLALLTLSHFNEFVPELSQQLDHWIFRDQGRRGTLAEGLTVLLLYKDLSVDLKMSAGAYESGIRKLQLLALVTDDMEASRASVRLKAAAHVTLVSLNIFKQDDFPARAAPLFLFNSISGIGGGSSFLTGQTFAKFGGTPSFRFEDGSRGAVAQRGPLGASVRGPG